MTLTYDLFWSFRSPYSYLVTPRLLGFERDFDVQANVRPVYPIAVRIDGFFKTVNPFWWSYLRRDVARTAEMLGLPHSPPNPDPIVMDLKSGEVSKEQPLHRPADQARRCCRRTRQGPAASQGVSAVIFGGTRDWHLGDHVARAVARSGLDLSELDRAIEANAERIEATIASNEAAQKGAGHWGVPLMVFNGEPFFGQDRFEALKWRMMQKGLQRRA